MVLVKIFFNLLYFVFSCFVVIFFIPMFLFIRLIRRVRNNKTLNILIAGIETSNNIRQIASVLSKQDCYRVWVHEFVEHPLYSAFIFPPDVHLKTIGTVRIADSFLKQELSKYIRVLFFISNSFRYDVFFFNWTQSYLSANLDYALIKLSGIHLLVRHCGSDVRYRPLQHGVHSSFGIYQWDRSSPSLASLLAKLYKQTIAELFAEVLSSRDFATFQRGPLIVRPYIQTELPKSIGLSLGKPIILHAPSNPIIKGTENVLKAIALLKEKRDDFEFLMLTKRPHEEVLEALSRTSILIDQPGAFPARLATEGFASSCVVIGGNVASIHGFPNCPAIQFPSDAINLAEILDNLLNDRAKLQDISRLSFSFWKTNCSEESFLSFFAKLIYGNAETFTRLPEHERLLSSAASRWYEKAAIFFRYGRL